MRGERVFGRATWSDIRHMIVNDLTDVYPSQERNVSYTIEMVSTSVNRMAAWQRSQFLLFGCISVNIGVICHPRQARTGPLPLLFETGKIAKIIFDV